MESERREIDSDALKMEGDNWKRVSQQCVVPYYRENFERRLQKWGAEDRIFDVLPRM